MKKIKILAFYKFINIASVSSLKVALLNFCQDNEVKGLVLLATEGLNGTIAGDEKNIDCVLNFFKNLPGCEDIQFKASYVSEPPFLKLRVRVKKEIISMGIPEVNPRQAVGNYINAEDWNRFVERDDVVMIDTRNDYEVSIGSFDGSINPNTKCFRDFPAWWNKNSYKYRDKKIAMFCTGGIRCEKSTNYLIQKNHKNVFHLRGGILSYLTDVSEKESKWQGECFVFDQRVSVKHGLKEGSYNLCFACRRPISDSDKSDQQFEEGVSCPQCINEHSAKRKDGFRERQRQKNLK